MRQICDPITAPFEDFDLVVEAFDKTARLTVDEIIRDLIHPVLQRRQETVKAFEPALADTLHPAFYRRVPGFFAVVGLENPGQFLSQFIGSLQVRRAFKVQRQPLAFFFVQLFRY